MPDWLVYYLDLMCTKFPAINAAYASRLSDRLKSSSTEAPADDNDPKPNKKDNFLKVMEQATANMEESQAEAKKQRASLIAIQKRHEESSGWDEYMRLAKSVKQMHADLSDDEDDLLFNLAVRVHTLEKRLGVKRSVLKKLGISVPMEDLEENKSENEKENENDSDNNNNDDDDVNGTNDNTI